MTTRSHTETFVLLRNNALKHRSFSKFDEYDEEKVTLVGERVKGNREQEEDELGSNIPSWLSLVDAFRYESSKIGNKIQQLKELQESFLRSKASSIFEEGENSKSGGYEAEIDLKSQEISRLFNRLHGLVTQMKSVQNMVPSSRLVSNILNWEYREISDLTHSFRSCQRNYLNQVQDRDKFSQQFIINFDDDFEYSQPKFAGDPVYIESGINGDSGALLQKQRQVMVPLMDTDMLRERDAEMSVIMGSIVELNQVFHDISALVVNQGSLLDRIDYNLETVQYKVGQGVIELSKAEKSARNSRKMKCIMILAGTVLLMLLILVIQS